MSTTLKKKVLKQKINQLQKPFLLAIVIVLVLLKAISYIYFFQNSDPYYLYTDDAIYATLANRFLNGDYYNAFHPYWNPGFSLAQIPFYHVFGSWENAQVALRLVSSLLLIVATYLSIRKISKTAAVVASFLITFSPAVDGLTLDWGISEPFYVLLIYISAYFMFKSLTLKNATSYIFSGLFLGMAYLTRTEAIASPGFYILLVLAATFTKRRVRASVPLKLGRGFRLNNFVSLTFLILGLFFYFHFRTERGIYFAAAAVILAIYFIFYEVEKNMFAAAKQFLKSAILILVPFVIVNSFYFASISKQIGSFTVSGKYAYQLSGPPFKLEPRLYTSYAQDVWSIDFPNYKSKFYDKNAAAESTWKNLDTGLSFLPKKVGENLSYYAAIYSQSGVILVLGSLVLILLYPRTRKLALFFTGFMLVNLVWVSFSMEMVYRYIAFAIPFFHVIEALAVWVAIHLITKYLKNKSKRKLIGSFCVVLFCAAYIINFVSIDEFFTPRRSNPKDQIYQKEIVAWLVENKVTLFMGRTEGLPLYAKARMVYLPQGTPEVIVDYAKAWGVEYIIARPDETSWSYMKEINNPDFKHPDIGLAHKFGDNSLMWKVNLTLDERTNNMRTGVTRFRGVEVY